MSTPLNANQTFDDTNGDLQYQGFWTLNGTWSAPSLDQSGTLSSSNDPNASVEFTFPIPANVFYYYGMGRSRGGLYQICIDCDVNQPHADWITIDALNREDNGQNPPVVLFSQTFNTASVHRIIIRNQNDTRVVPSGNSQITVDRFVLGIINDTPNTPGITTPTPPTLSPSKVPVAPATSSSTSPSTSLDSVERSSATLMPLTVSLNPSALSTTSGSTSQSGPRTSSLSTEVVGLKANKTPLGPIIGGVLGFIILSGILALLGYRRLLGSKNRTISLGGNVPELTSSNMVIVRPFIEPVSSPSSAKRDGDPIRTYMDIKPVRKAPGLTPTSTSVGASSSHSRSQPSSSFSADKTPSTSTLANIDPSTDSTGGTRREIDGGSLTVIRPGGQDEGVEALPPAYGQIFGY